MLPTINAMNNTSNRIQITKLIYEDKTGDSCNINMGYLYRHCHRVANKKNKQHETKNTYICNKIRPLNR